MGVFTQTRKSSEGTFDLCPAGSHPACLVAMVDFGTRDEEFQDQKTGEKKVKKTRKIYLAWEVDEDKQGGGGKILIGREYTLSLGKKAALAALIGQWRGKELADGEEFDLSKLLGKPCLLTVTHQESGEKTYHRMSGVSALPKGMTPYKPSVTPWSWEIDSGADIPAAVDGLPYVYGVPAREKIKDCDEWKARGHAGNGKPVDAFGGNPDADDTEGF
jgi:hypothetical protein